MRVEHVRAFVALAEELNYRRAAALVYVSQPTLTAQIAALERTLAVTLFDRGPGGTRLTAAGEDLLPVAREVLRAVEDLVDGAGSWRGPGHVPSRGRRRARIGIGPGGIGPATWPSLQALAARRPDLEPTAVPLSFTTALPALERGEVEAVLLHGPVDEDGHRRVRTVGRVPVAVIVPMHHWLAARTELGVDEVAPLVRAVPPPEIGAAFARFWLLADHPRSPVAGLRLGSEETHAMAGEVARAGLVGLWPSDVEVPPASGAVVRPLAQQRLAPLQVVTRAGWEPGEDLVAAATASVRAVAGLRRWGAPPPATDRHP
ncbi:MAG TPA: LysR family transcriptional regulator [Ornithinibacter sp.]|nr:LysR family transcriptional regulator [Ornithinibacter sp.]